MMGSFQRVATILALGVLAVTTAFGQTPQGPPAKPLSSSIERSYADGTPVRQVQTRTESNGREVVTETTERPDFDGRMKPVLQTTTETVRTGPGTTQIKHDVYAPDANGRQQLVESQQAETHTLPDGSSRTESNTFTPDANGRLTFASREVQETKSPSANVKETNTSIFQTGVNQAPVESERLQQVEKKISAEVTQNESAHSFRDGTGQWQTTETRSEEVRTTKTERVSEETVRRRNDTGALSLSEKIVTRESRKNGQDETVTETYSANTPGGLASSIGRLELDQRVRQTTSTITGGQQTVREVEGRKPGSPNEPLRVIERTVETVKQTGPNQWEVQREVYALDGNGRLVAVTKERGKASGK